MSPYRIAQGSAAVSGAQAIPVPELAAAHLKPGESLTLRYDLQSRDVADFTATITLKTRKKPDCLSGITLNEPVTSGLQSLAMCLPGFRLEEAEAAIIVNEVRLDPGYSAILLAPQHDWLDDAGVESHQSGQRSTPLIRLPAFAPGSIRVDRLLEALITSGRASSLSVEIGRVSLGRRDIKLIERAREALRAREMSLPADGSEASMVRFHLAYLHRWAVARAGVSLSFRLGFDGQSEPNLMKVAADMLYGPRPDARLAPVADRCPDFDFSLSVASMMKAPILLPPAAELDRLGFFSRRRWHGKADDASACQIGRALDGAPVALEPADLGRHLYIIGATGVGKSTLMARMIQQDIEQGLPTVVIDPHGDLFNEINDGLSDDQRQRACIADLSAIEGGFGLDLLDMSGNRPDIRLNFVCNQLIAVFRKVLYRDQPEGFGPMFESYFRNALMLLVLGNPNPCSLSDFDRVFGDPK